MDVKESNFSKMAKSKTVKKEKTKVKTASKKVVLKAKVEASLEKLLEVGAHFGHQVKRWNPKVSEFIYGQEGGVHIFDLVKTKESLDVALSEVAKYFKEGKTILLVGTKKQISQKVEEVGKNCKIPFVSQRWLGGTLTNFDQIKKSLDKLALLKKNLSEGYYARHTKKERLLVEREILRLEKLFGGISELKDKPDMLVVLDIKKDETAVNEAKRMGIVTVGIVDSNTDPKMVDYPVPMNDDAARSVGYFLELLEQALKVK